MTSLVLICLFGTVTPSEALWQLRFGILPDTPAQIRGGSEYISAIQGDMTPSMGLHQLRSGLLNGHIRLIASISALLVSSGDPYSAKLYWLNPYDPPVTREELLSALAWNGRFELYSALEYRAVIPEDMAGRLNSERCAAVYSVGWMRPRKDGLFHPDELVSPGDLQLLAPHFPGFTGITFLRSSELEDCFRGSR